MARSLGRRGWRGMAGGVLGIAAAGFAGCAGGTEMSPAVVVNPKYDDVPVPYNFRQAPSRGQTHVAFRVAELTYLGSARVDRTADWYAAQMPRFRWTLEGSEGGAGAKRAVLRFTKNEERCLIVIEPEGDLTAVRIEIGYKNAAGS